MNPFARVMPPALSMLVVGALFGACSNATQPVYTGQTSQDLACQSGGIHIEDCPIGKVHSGAAPE